MTSPQNLHYPASANRDLPPPAFTFGVPSMRLSDILKLQHIKVPLLAKNKKDAITELVHVLADAKQVKDSQSLLNSVLEREATRTTGIGNGLAIPHGKCAGVDH